MSQRVYFAPLMNIVVPLWRCFVLRGMNKDLRQLMFRVYLDRCNVLREVTFKGWMVEQVHNIKEVLGNIEGWSRFNVDRVLKRKNWEAPGPVLDFMFEHKLCYSSAAWSALKKIWSQKLKPIEQYVKAAPEKQQRGYRYWVDASGELRCAEFDVVVAREEEEWQRRASELSWYSYQY